MRNFSISLVTALLIINFPSISNAWERQVNSYAQRCISNGVNSTSKQVTDHFLSLSARRSYSDSIFTEGKTFTLQVAYVSAGRGSVTIGFDNGQAGPRLDFADRNKDGLVDRRRSAFVDNISRTLSDEDGQVLYCAWGLYFMGRS